MTSAAVVYGGGGSDDIAAAEFKACEARRIVGDGRLIKYTHSVVRSPIGQTGQSAQLLLLLNIVRAALVCVCARVARAAL